MDAKIEVFRLAQGEFGVNGPDGYRVSTEETTRLRHMFEAAPEVLEAHGDNVCDADAILACVAALTAGTPDRIAHLQHLAERARSIHARSHAAQCKATGGEQ